MDSRVSSLGRVAGLPDFLEFLICAEVPPPLGPLIVRLILMSLRWQMHVERCSFHINLSRARILKKLRFNLL